MAKDNQVAATGDNFLPAIEHKPLDVLLDPKKAEEFYAAIQAAISASTPDLVTEKGRKAIASLAFKVARSKKPIEEAANEATADWRKKLAEVTEAKKTILGKLDELRDLARKPLNDWEDERAKVESATKEVLDVLARAPQVDLGATPASIDVRIQTVRDLVIDEEVFGDRYAITLAMRDSAISTLEGIKTRLVQQEAANAEMERMRAELAQLRAQSAQAGPRLIAGDPANGTGVYVAAPATAQTADGTTYDKATGEVIEPAPLPDVAALAAAHQAQAAPAYQGGALSALIAMAEAEEEPVAPGFGTHVEPPVVIGANAAPPACFTPSDEFVTEVAMGIAKAMGMHYPRLQPDGGDDVTQADFRRAAAWAIPVIANRLGGK